MQKALRQTTNDSSRVCFFVSSKQSNVSSLKCIIYLQKSSKHNCCSYTVYRIHSQMCVVMCTVLCNYFNIFNGLNQMSCAQSLFHQVTPKEPDLLVCGQECKQQLSWPTGKAWQSMAMPTVPTSAKILACCAAIILHSKKPTGK